MPSRSLAELLAAAEQKKHQAIRDRIGLPADARIDTFQLEALSYHLSERSGPVEIRLVGEDLLVSEPGSPSGIAYRGDAAKFLLETWGISRAQAENGCVLKVNSGKRVA